MKPRNADVLLRAMAVVAVAFGLLTIASGGLTLFGGDAARQSAGAYVPFVLRFNFVAGFAYVVAGIGLWLQRRWAVWLAAAIAAAMSLRGVVWLAIAWLAARRVRLPE